MGISNQHYQSSESSAGAKIWLQRRHIQNSQPLRGRWLLRNSRPVVCLFAARPKRQPAGRPALLVEWRRLVARVVGSYATNDDDDVRQTD